MDNEGDIECICDVGFSSKDCPACSGNPFYLKSENDADFFRREREKKERLADLFSPMALYRQVKGEPRDE